MKKFEPPHALGTAIAATTIATTVLAATLLATTVFAQSDSVTPFEHFKAPNGVEFDYVVLLPEPFDKGRAYPTLMAFPPGDMDREAVEWSRQNLWGSANDREWIIVMPTQPNGTWLTHPAHHALNAFMDKVKSDYKVAGNFHVTGYASSGRTSVTYANMSREYFDSVTVAAGDGWARWDDDDLANWCRNNKDMPVRILVGEYDEAGRKQAERVEKTFRAGGVPVTLKVVPGYGKGLESLLDGGLLTEVAENAGTIGH